MNTPNIFRMSCAFYFLYLCHSSIVLSKRSVITSSGLPILLITIVTINFRKKPGTISYKSTPPPERKSPHLPPVVAPTRIPHDAPVRGLPRQKRDKTIIGPQE